MCFSTGLQGQPFVMGHLMGQFGNQMFIIAATTSLALDNGAVPVFPNFHDESEPVFKLSYNYQKVFYHLNANLPENAIEYTYRESRFTYDPIPYTPNMRLFGWFQSEKYFKHHKNEILDLFAPHPEITEYLSNKYRDIIDHPKTVSIHFRNYLAEDPEQKVYYTYGMDYYEKAIMLFPEDSLFVVFSNDIEWCKKNMSAVPRNIVFIEGEKHYHDFYLMSLCKDHIIGNSSFSWWAAYLNRNPDKKVIVPPEWFAPSYNHDWSDLIPEEWIVLQ
jgi:hypothetical protein